MHKLAIIRGDGIGPEISEATQKVIEASGVSVDWEKTPVGSEAMERFGAALPLSSVERIRQLGVVLKAPLLAERCSGGVTIDTGRKIRRYPSLNNGLRRELGSFANVRPIRGWDSISGRWSKMNIILVREVTEGIYSGIERRIDGDIAEAVKRVTRNASRRISEFACNYAVRFGRKKITAVHKANVLHLTDGLFLETASSVAAGFPQLKFDDVMVDAACYLLVKRPETFDVLVLPNQYGDILSDVAAGLAGSLGLAPGVNIGDHVSMFEASHGAAPDIAGKNLANPISLILSGALLLDHVGETAAAKRIRGAVEQVLSRGESLTPDLGGSGTTSGVTQAICSAMQSQ